MDGWLAARHAAGDTQASHLAPYYSVAMTNEWTFASRYRCFEELGEGGFGQVWRAQDLWLNKPVALKLFDPALPPGDAFFEAQLLESLRGEHILPVWDVGVEDDVAFLTTEIATAGTADAAMGSLGVPTNDAVRWVNHVLLGLDVCHGRGIVHRDVKPPNIFLDSPDHVRLGDLGVAALLDEDGRVGIHGDPRIVSPEMIETGSGDVRSDIYSAGVTLYALLAGRYPFDGDDVNVMFAKKLADDYPRLTDVAPHVPQALAQRVARAMARGPDDRYPSARDFREDLAKVAPTVIWRRLDPHQGHVRCWRGIGRGRRARAYLVCVEERDQGGFRIETRRDSGRRRRMRLLCKDVPSEARLPIDLREVFRKIGRTS